MPRRPAQNEPQTPPGGWRTLTHEDPEAWPKAVVFDLDYTLWDLWIDTHITPPLRRKEDALNHVLDRRNGSLQFYYEVPAILRDLHAREIHIAVASRTGAIDLANEALALLSIPGPGTQASPVAARSYFKTLEIYPSSKKRHFGEIHRKTGIEYEQMLFFDDEHRNFEVEELGVTMQFITKGTNWKAFNDGLAEWRRRRGIKIIPAEE